MRHQNLDHVLNGFKQVAPAELAKKASASPIVKLQSLIGDTESICRVLEELAPDKCPSPNDTDREIWMKVGARLFAEKLMNALREKNKNV